MVYIVIPCINHTNDNHDSSAFLDIKPNSWHSFLREDQGGQMKNTPHIKPNGVQIAETILLPGDPLRAKFIADTFLEDVVTFNTVRNMFGYTGTYNNKKISVMGTGMGMPSVGIYAYELIHTFGVKNLIRIGSCGAMQEDLKLYDIIIALGASTNSNFACQYKLQGTFAPTASWSLLNQATEVAKEKSIPVHVGNILTSDIFYNNDEQAMYAWKEMGILAEDMETAALYMMASKAGVNALTLLTVSDHMITHEQASTAERQTAFTQMMAIALELA